MRFPSRLALAFCLAALATLDAQTWSELLPATKPGARTGANLAFDARNNRAVLFGGMTASTPESLITSNETWLWDGAAWTKANPPNSPPARVWGAMVYDEERGEVVLFGGRGDNLGVELADTWVWNGTTWTQRTPAVSPPSRYALSMAYDPVRKVVVLFGGFAGGARLGDTWTWNGTTWTRMTPPVSPSPAPGVLAWDAVRQVVVGYFATAPQHTWVWNGTNWTNRTGSVHPMAFESAAVSHAGRVVLVDSFNRQSWTWDGSEWRQLLTNSLPSLPPPAVGRAVAYDAVRERTIQFGGTDPSAYLNDFWSLAIGSACIFTDTQPFPIAVPAAGGTFEIPIAVTAGCTWTASSASSRITFVNGSGTGPGVLRFTITANPGPIAASETISVGARSYVVKQPVPACPSGGPLPSSPFTLRNDCDQTYTITANAGDQLALLGLGRGQARSVDFSWSSHVEFKITGPGSSTSVIAQASPPGGLSGPATYLPQSGAVTFPATGVYTVAITLTGGEEGSSTIYPLRTGSVCTPQLLRYHMYGGGVVDALELPAAGTAPSTDVTWTYLATLPPGCPAAAVTSPNAWIQPMPQSIQPGFRQILPGVQINTGTTRTGVLNIGPTPIAVTQEGSESCTYSIDSPLTVAMPSGRTAAQLNLTTSAYYCPWQVSSDVPWLQPYPLSGVGSGSIRYTVFPNFGTGIRSGTLRFAGKVLTVTQSPESGSAMERFVKLLYFSFFGRMPSPAEVSYQVGAGQSRQQLALNFLNSREFNEGGRYVAGLYVGVLNRDAEYGGWLFQRDALTTGLVDHLALMANFLGSAEFVGRFGSLDNRSLIELLYRNVLLRNASTAEVDFHVNSIVGGLSRVQVARNILGSDEFTMSIGARLGAFLVYAALLQRQPSPVEFTLAMQAITLAQSQPNINARDAFIRDQILAPLVNGAEMSQILQ